MPREQVVAVAAGDGVIAGPAEDKIQSRSPADDIVVGTAVETVISVAAPDLQCRDQPALLLIAWRETPFALGLRELVFGITMDLVIARPGVDDRAFDVARLIIALGLCKGTIRAVPDKFLIGDIPDQTGEFVTMNFGVVANRYVIRHGIAEPVEIAAQEQHLIVAGAAVEAVAQRRDQRALRAFNKGEPVREKLEDVVACFAEQQVAGLPVEPAGEDIVACSAKDPVFPGAA